MWRLYQFPLCPFSRKIRLLLSEKNVAYELVREDPWAASDYFWNLNPAGRTPVMAHQERDTVLCDSRAIAEYFEETVDKAPMINGTAANRAEIRRLVALFDENFYNDVTAPLLNERMKKRLVLNQPPDSRTLREAMKLAHGDRVDFGVRHLQVEDGPGRALGRSFGVTLWPTLVFLHDGQERQRLVRPRDAGPVAAALQALTRG